MAIWFDLSPMRPDEWANTVAERWYRNARLKAAYLEGVNDARDEVKGQLKAAGMAKAKR